MINIAVCDDDLVFASKVETILYDISKQKLIDIAVEVFLMEVSCGNIFLPAKLLNYYIWT